MVPGESKHIPTAEKRLRKARKTLSSVRHPTLLRNIVYLRTPAHLAEGFSLVNILGKSEVTQVHRRLLFPSTIPTLSRIYMRLQHSCKARRLRFLSWILDSLLYVDGMDGSTCLDD